MINSTDAVQTPGGSAFSDEERRAKSLAIAAARAQCNAGDIVPGEAVLRWIASWGTADELPSPEPARPSD